MTKKVQQDLFNVKTFFESNFKKNSIYQIIYSFIDWITNLKQEVSDRKMSSFFWFNYYFNKHTKINLTIRFVLNLAFYHIIDSYK